MCPLRLILIFLSATLAGFFVLKNLKSHPEVNDEDEDSPHNSESSTSPLQLPSNSLNRSSKVCEAIGRGFWICVDMASGRYLWRNLVSSSSSSPKSAISSDSNITFDL